jgi:hypothetical protein
VCFSVFVEYSSLVGSMCGLDILTPNNVHISILAITCAHPLVNQYLVEVLLLVEYYCNDRVYKFILYSKM